MLYLTRSLIVGPHPLLVPLPFLPPPLPEDVPETRWLHVQPATPSNWYMLFPTSTHANAAPWQFRDPLSFIYPSSGPTLYDGPRRGTPSPVPDWDASAYLRLTIPVDIYRPTAVPAFLVPRLWQVRVPGLVSSIVASFLDASDGDAYSLLSVRAESDSTVIRLPLGNWVTLGPLATSASRRACCRRAVTRRGSAAGTPVCWCVGCFMYVRTP